MASAWRVCGRRKIEEEVEKGWRWYLSAVSELYIFLLHSTLDSPGFCFKGGFVASPVPQIPSPLFDVSIPRLRIFELYMLSCNM